MFRYPVVIQTKEVPNANPQHHPIQLSLNDKSAGHGLRNSIVESLVRWDDQIERCY